MVPSTLEDVVRGGLCAGCGICESLAGSDRVVMEASPGGQLRPRIAVDLAPAEQERLVAVCPGATATGPAGPATEPGTTLDPVWGPMRGLSRAWAADPEIRHRAAAGGALTALACFLLDTGRVDAIVHVRASTERPMLTDALVSRTSADAIAGAQSRYGPSAPLVHVHRLLDAGDRLAVIAKPCDVAAIRNLGRRDARVRAQVPYLLTLFCGGVPNSTTAERIAAHHGLAAHEVSLLRWRGNGWPGPTRVESAAGDAHELSYDATWFDPAVPWGYDVQWRCKICPDAIGELADLSCPDGWILDGDRRPVHDEAPGVNAIVERTRAGSELVAAAAAAGYLELASLTRADLDAMHHDQRERRLGEPARLAALRATGAAAPRVTGYRMSAAARLAGPALLLRQFRGAVRRIRSGQATEPLVRNRKPTGSVEA